MATSNQYILDRAGLRATRQRHDLLDLFREARKPLSAEEAFQHLSQQGSSLDLATVYRNVKRLESCGALTAMRFPDGLIRYEWPHAHTGHHHHIRCRKCGRMDPLRICPDEALTRLVQGSGYHDLKHTLEFEGVCDPCNQR